jgi:rSAM/selenodomain-associated transferase 1
MNTSDCLLLIFIKNPHPGKVKTRLGATIGDEAAVEVYKKLMAITREASLHVDCDRHLHYGDYINTDDDWNPNHFEKHLQVDGDLGARMHHAFDLGFRSGYKKVMIIGSDCPDMDAGLMEEAFKSLDEHNLVIGPAEDGGYYLLGMSKPFELFSDMQWSTESVYEQTLERAKKQNASIATMPVLSDLDTIEDLEKYPHLQ